MNADTFQVEALGKAKPIAPDRIWLYRRLETFSLPPGFGPPPSSTVFMKMASVCLSRASAAMWPIRTQT